MIKSKIGVSPPRQSNKQASSRDGFNDKIQLKINEYESQLQKIRDDIFNLHVELFQISSPAKKAIVKPILQSIDKLNEEYELTLKKYDLSQNLVQTFQSIIDIYPIDQSKLKKQEKNKPLSSASSNVVKPHIKQYIDFTKNSPFERPKTTQCADQRNQTKKKIDTHQNYQVIKTLGPAEEKEIRTKKDFIGLLENDLRDLKKANDHLIRRFGTNSGFRVSSQIKYGQKINKTLRDNLNDFQVELEKISDQIRQYESTIDSLQDPPHYTRMLDEGKKYKEHTTKRVNDLLQEASDRVKLGQQILASIEKVASLLDPNHLSSGIVITELQWIMQKLSKLLHKNITTSPIKNSDSIWDLTKTSTLKIFDDENSSSNINNSSSMNSNFFNTNNNGSFANENEENFPEIPEIPIMSMFPNDQSLGNTRQTRRLFSALSSLRSGNDGDESVGQSLRTLGVLLGNVFVDRFSPLFHQNDHPISIAEPSKVFLPKPLSKTMDLSSLLQLYVKYRSDICLTQLKDDEIQQLDPDFLSFSAEKKLFKENLSFTTEEFVKFFTHSISTSLKNLKSSDRQSPKRSSVFDDDLITPSLWMAHDFATNEAIPLIIQKMTPVFKKLRKSFVVSNPSIIAAWAAMIASFFRCKSRPTKEALLALYDPIFPILLDKDTPKITDTPQSRCITLALLRYGKHYPREFLNFTNLRNNTTSYLHNFIQWNITLPTFVCSAIKFAKSAIALLNSESLTWHTSLFYHYAVRELMQKSIRTNIVKSFLSILCAIVENRDSSMTLLLKRIYFIYFLKKNFELEEIFCEKQDESKIIPIAQAQSQPLPIAKNNTQQESFYTEKYGNQPQNDEEEAAEEFEEEEEEAEEESAKTEFEPSPVPKINLTPKGTDIFKQTQKEENTKIEFEPSPVPKINLTPKGTDISKRTQKEEENTKTEFEQSPVPKINLTPKGTDIFKQTQKEEENTKTDIEQSPVPKINLTPKGTDISKRTQKEEESTKTEFEQSPVPKINLTPKGTDVSKRTQKEDDDEESMPYVPPISFNFTNSGLNQIQQSKSSVGVFGHTQALTLMQKNTNFNTDNNEGMKMPIVPSISFSKMNENSNRQENSKTNISYNDLSNVSPIPLNLDNPKLQLHFQKATTNLAPVRSSVSFSNSDYMSERNNYPIYLDLGLHSMFVKTMFAILVDHSLNRFDVFFCDPFPFVNRKPNILFTLMQHMESSANIELKDDLFDREKDNAEKEESDIPPIPPINVLSALKSFSKNDSSENDTEFNEPQLKRVLLPPVSPINKQSRGLALNLVPLKSVISTPKFFDQGSMMFDQKETGNNAGEFFSLDSLLPEAMHSRNEYKYLIMIKKKKQQANLILAKRLMRLTMPCLFNKKNYLNGRHIASGAFGSVMVCRSAEQDKYLAVKILKKSKNEYDNPHLFEVFTEVSILEMCQNDRRVTQLNDYGCTSNSYYIIMEYYPTTLKAWRKKNANPEIKTLLRLYREFLNACTVLADKHINHYDIKCDNVMVDQNGFPCLADFGESMCYTSDKNCFTMLNKGTEWIKSPEMLSIALNSTITNPNFDRRKKVGAGPESDVWSIGCLFYELVTSEFLFAETNWSHFFRRITESDQTLILPENKQKLPEDPRFCAFLEFVLQRNFRSRPNLNQVISKFDEMFPEALNSPLPVIEIPTFD